MKFLSTCCLVAEDLQHLLRLAQAGVRLAQQLGDVLRAAREAGAELGDDQPQAVAVGPPHHVVHEVRRDRRGRPRVRDDRAVLERLASSRRAGSRRSTRRSATAGGSRTARRSRKALKPGSVISPSTTAHVRGGPSVGVVALALGALRDLELLRLAGVHAADAEVAALGEAEGVVERHLERSCPSLSSLAAPADHHGRRAGDASTSRTASSRRITGPVPRRARSLFALQSSRCCSSAREHVRAVVGAITSPPPGQRLYCLVRASSPNDVRRSVSGMKLTAACA